MRALATDTLEGQDITSALAVATYTADAARKLILRAFADGVAGGGEYTCYASVQLGGAGPEYVSLPKTLAEAGAGETSVAFQSMALAVASGDVVKVYLLGLAGDVSVDTRVVVHEDDGIDVAAVSGDALAANHLESMFDGTGFADPYAPATQAGLANLDGDVAELHANVALAVDLTALQASVDAQELHQDEQDALLAAIQAKTALIAAGRTLTIYPEGAGVWGDLWYRRALP